jgi:HD-GYP domain-containing protein (c-di-GMP phosphodiesterase class II)
MESLQKAYAPQEIGMAIMSGIDSLPHAYVLFDRTGRLKYGNRAFHHMFSDAAKGTDVISLLREKLGINDFSQTHSEEGIESLCVGFLQQDDETPKTFSVRSAPTVFRGQHLFQCIISQIRPQSALQVGIREIGMKDKVRLAKLVGAITMEMDMEETGQHLLRTSRHLFRLGETMKASGTYNFPEGEIDDASTCSILHDVGKMSIPSCILHKPERVTEIEWYIIKNHVVAGLTLAESLNMPKLATDIIAYHHCRWDGVQDRWDAILQKRDPVRGGYPFCASRDNIPIWARAFAYVDIFDALVTPRSYKPAWSVPAAVYYISGRLVGTHLDPGIFPSFLQSVDENACLPAMI